MSKTLNERFLEAWYQRYGQSPVLARDVARDAKASSDFGKHVPCGHGPTEIGNLCRAIADYQIGPFMLYRNGFTEGRTRWAVRLVMVQRSMTEWPPDPIHEPAHYQARAKPCDECEEWLDCYANLERPCQEGVTDAHLYAELDRVLAMARAQAAEGKGKDRHAVQGQPFEEQVIVADSVALGSNHGNLLQIIKKGKESARLPKDAAIAELLGVINNAAAAILVLEKLDEMERNR